MTTGLLIFTMLWVVSCYCLYSLLLRKLEAADKKYDEGCEFSRQAEQRFREAADQYQQALETNQSAQKRLEQIEQSIRSLN